MSESAQGLVGAIWDLHHCAASFVEAVPVREVHQGRTVWAGEVSVFDLTGHPTATRCYAWSHEAQDGKRRYVAVLHEPPVDSPRAAVRAAIAAEFRNG